MIRSHKIRLRPTTFQKEQLHRAFAAARHSWNWAKEILDAEYDINRITYRETGQNYKFTNIDTNSKTTGQKSLKALYNSVKPEWVKGTASATQESFSDIKTAMGRYFDIRKGKIKVNLKTDENGKPKRRKDGRHHGWLNWRSKKNHNSFRVTNISLKLDGLFVRYNTKVGYIRMCEELRFEGKIMNATFSYDGQWYWASIQVEIEPPEFDPSPNAVGVDLGIKYLAVTSDGQFEFNPKAYYPAQAKLRRLQRKRDRQSRANNPQNYNDNGTVKRGRLTWNTSNQMIRTQDKINKLHSRIKQIRRNAQHQLTAGIVKQYGLIVIEDLNVNGMLKNRKLAKAISDAGFGEIRRQFEYKAEYYSGLVEVVDRWFPSSKLCSGCGWKKLDMDLSDREWTCEECGQVNERDLNAAINLKNEGLRIFANPDFIPPAGSPVAARTLTLDIGQVVRETPTT